MFTVNVSVALGAQCLGSLCPASRASVVGVYVLGAQKLPDRAPFLSSSSVVWSSLSSRPVFVVPRCPWRCTYSRVGGWCSRLLSNRLVREVLKGVINL